MTRSAVYRHFRGGLYRVLFVATESTNGRPRVPTVVYVSLENGSVNVRDEAEFHEMVEGNDHDSLVMVPRFAFERE